MDQDLAGAPPGLVSGLVSRAIGTANHEHNTHRRVSEVGQNQVIFNVSKTPVNDGHEQEYHKTTCRGDNIDSHHNRSARAGYAGSGFLTLPCKLEPILHDLRFTSKETAGPRGLPLKERVSF